MNPHSTPFPPPASLNIVVLGGTGLIGRQLVKNLQASGHRAIAASPSTGVNAVTGEGLAAVLAGANVVVDVTNSPSFEEKAALEFFVNSSRHVLAAEVAAGVSHHVALSVVGTDRVTDSAYFRAKLAQEKLIQASPVPSTIVRATQFFEFAAFIAQSATAGDRVRLPAKMMQPIAAEDVAATLAEIAQARPMNRILDLAGPEKIPQDALVRRLFAATADSRHVETDDSVGYFGAKIDHHSLVPLGDTLLGKIRFSDWLARHAATP